MAEAGSVYLVGAGPGDPKLITVRGLECLRLADVVVYDRLASVDLLAEARPDAERIYVGKAAGDHAMSQTEINRVLVDRAVAGWTVVRLKGGDPFVFGRGGEEAEVLAARGIPFEVVPGVTSAVAAPACAGIPVTHRGVATSFAVVTGHDLEAVNWPALARATDTLVFLMGLANLDGIAERLIAHGRPRETPVAVVSAGSTPDQQVVTGTLATASGLEGLPSPAVIIVGDVVRLREKLSWL